MTEQERIECLQRVDAWVERVLDSPRIGYQLIAEHAVFEAKMARLKQRIEKGLILLGFVALVLVVGILCAR